MLAKTFFVASLIAATFAVKQAVAITADIASFTEEQQYITKDVVSYWSRETSR